MDNTERLISLYHTGFLVCLGLAIVGLIMAIVLFFLLDIRGTYMRMSGKARQLAVIAMQEENMKTGKLVSEDIFEKAESEVTQRQSGGSIASVLRKSRRLDRSGRTGGTGKTGTTGKTGKKAPSEQAIALQAPEAAKQSPNTVSAYEATPVLQQAEIGTELLHADKSFQFKITETIVVIHTNETI